MVDEIVVDEIAEALSGCFVDSAEVGSDLQLHDSLSTVLFDKCYDGHRMVNHYYAVLLFFFVLSPLAFCNTPKTNKPRAWYYFVIYIPDR